MDYVKRITWSLVQPAWYLSPRLCWFWRRWMLRLFGAKIESKVRIFASSKVSQPWNLTVGYGSTISWDCTLYCLGEIKIGRKILISQGVHLCAGSHDIYEKGLPLQKKSIYIDDFSWIAAEAFVGPGVVIGKNVVIGARSVIMKNVNENEIRVGNPSRCIGYRL